jgi:hypothetical protein
MQITFPRPLDQTPSVAGEVFSLLLLLTMPFAIFLTMLAGDDLLSLPVNGVLHNYWPLLDSVIHFALGLLVVSPFFLNRPSFRKTLGLTAAVFATSVLVDFDHIIAARSLSLYAITHLSVRPPTHSLMFALAIGILVWLVCRRIEYGWLVFAALASHFIRDASTGGMLYFLWPAQVQKISLVDYQSLELLIFLSSGLLIFVQYYYLPAVKAWISNHAASEPQQG